MSPADAGTPSSASSGPLRQAYSEISPPLARPMDTLASLDEHRGDVGEPDPADEQPHPQRQPARVRVDACTDAPSAAMPEAPAAASTRDRDREPEREEHQRDRHAGRGERRTT